MRGTATAPVERPAPALVPLEPPHPPFRCPPERDPGQLVLPSELALADPLATSRFRPAPVTAGAYLDALQRLAAFGLDVLRADRSDLARFLSRGRRGRWGTGRGRPHLNPDRRTGCSPPLLREPYAGARGLSAEEVARLLAAIPVESAAGLRLRALILAYPLTGRYAARC